MTNANIEKKVTELKELEVMAKELDAEMESIKDELKAEMKNRDAEEITTSSHVVRYKEVISKRFDSKAFKETHSELYSQYTKETASMRFSVQ